MAVQPDRGTPAAPRPPPVHGPACREGEDVSGLSTPAPGESLPQSRGGFTLKFSCDVKPVDVKDVGGPLKHAA